MHHANHFYGHAHIMARYVGLVDPPRIWGYLQHGWNMYDGFAVGTVFAEGYPKFVYSQACARRGWAFGMRDYVVVGAPWNYLLDLERQPEWEHQGHAREGTIVYPFHGWEGQQVAGDHERYIDEIREIEGDVPITICLYINEYEQPRVRKVYERAGFRVITHGRRGYLWRGTDTEFLYRQLAEIRSHRRVVSNRMTSALLHGALAGAEVGVYGDPMELGGDHAVLGGAHRPQAMFPQFHQPFVPREYAREVSVAELGADQLLPPEEIIDLFGWTDEMDLPRRTAEEPDHEIDWDALRRRFADPAELPSARTHSEPPQVRPLGGF